MVIVKYTRCGDHSFGRAAASAIHNGSVGIERMNSMKRWMTSSTVPPKNPDMPPMIRPRKNEMNKPTTPMVREVRVAWNRRERRSRPS
jgi:hypothetical protein